MKIYVELEENERINSFSYAKAFFEVCEDADVNAETVAKMMLLKAKEPKGE